MNRLVERLRAATMRPDWGDLPDDAAIPAVPLLREAADALVAAEARSTALATAGQALVDAISFDDNGALIGGKWMGGNGGLLSRDTIAKADAMRRAIADA